MSSPRLCPFDRAWVGPCNKATSLVALSDYCAEHADKRCTACGEQATRECDYTGQFVCGYPLCATCTYTEGDSTKGLGWGFIGHKHVKPVGDPPPRRNWPRLPHREMLSWKPSIVLATLCRAMTNPSDPKDRPSRLIEGKVGPAAEAALKMLHESDGAIVKLVLRDKEERAFAAIILIEGEDTEEAVQALNAWESENER